MRLKKKSRTLAAGAGVALATSGLSSCQDNGAVDPPPPPLECNAVGDGQTLSATATVMGRELRVIIRHGGFGGLTALEIASVVGGSARPVGSLALPVTVVIDLTDESVTSGSFTLRATLGDSSTQCPIVRTFTFTIGPAGVVVASADELPLSARQQARIALIARDGPEVELEATTPFRGPQTILWTVTGGAIVGREGARLRWRLPAQAGLYQAEVVIDYGPSGLSVDTLAVEVS